MTLLLLSCAPRVVWTSSTPEGAVSSFSVSPGMVILIGFVFGISIAMARAVR